MASAVAQGTERRGRSREALVEEVGTGAIRPAVTGERRGAGLGPVAGHVLFSNSDLREETGFCRL